MATDLFWSTEGDALEYNYTVDIGATRIMDEPSTSGIYHSGGLNTTGDSSARPAELYFPAQSPIAIIMDEFPPMSAPEIQVRQVLRRTGVSQPRSILIWTGLATGYQIVDEVTRRVNAEGLTLRSSTGGLRMLWSRTCSHVLYDERCRVYPGDVVLSIPGVNIVDATSIQATSLATRPTGYFSGGHIEWDRVVLVPRDGSWDDPERIVFLDRRPIVAHYGDTVILEGGTAGLSMQGDMRFLPGCDRSLKMCSQRFGNSERFGGVFIDGRSPFDGNPVF